LFPGTDCEKIIFPQSLSVFLSSKKKFKIRKKIEAKRYMPEIPFVNGPLGVNKSPSELGFTCNGIFLPLVSK